LITSPDPSRTGMMLLNGDADVSWGGPMRVLQHHQADPACDLTCFAQVVARDPFLLVGNRPNPGFVFRDLQHCRVAVASDVPTPWLTFQDDLTRAGIAPSSIRTLPDRPMAENTAAFLRAEADVVQVLEPWADRLVQSGQGHVWHRFSVRGDIGYSTFYATRHFIDSNRIACSRLVMGLATALADFHSASTSSIADIIGPYFVDLDAATIIRVVASYRDAGVWARAPEFPVATFLRLKAALVSGGLLDRDVPYQQVVDACLSSSHPQ
jgi:NitT/TauT family transport system substrate-binding protein